MAELGKWMRRWLLAGKEVQGPEVSPKYPQTSFPVELLNEAAAHPGGWVYEIDHRYERDEAVPPHAIRRGWEVDLDGKPTGEFQDNLHFGVPLPLVAVEHILAEAKALAGGAALELLVANELTLKGQPVSFDVGITIAMDGVLALGYAPGDKPWMTPVEGGRRYLLERM